MILGIETATTVCGAALAGGGALIHESSLNERNVHSERLLGMVHEVLHAGACPPRKLQGIAVSIGPGSFTGLRIGLSVAKGLAYGAGIPIVGVPTLTALARHAAIVGELEPGSAVLAALDARRDEVYAQMFEWDGRECRGIGQPNDARVDRLVEDLPERTIYLTGDGAGKILTVRAAAARRLEGVPDPGGRCSAAQVALIGEQLFNAGVRDDLTTIEPKYIKEFFLQQR
jgi:tRNA threonylcarbamoyladenosine biosynthesis protein TsaB